MNKFLLSALVFFFCFATLHADSVDMEIDVVPELGFVKNEGLLTSYPIIHQGGNCKYLVQVKVTANLEKRWAVKIWANQLVSEDGKDTLDKQNVNYHIFGGAGAATPPQLSNGYLNVPRVPTVVYIASQEESKADETVFLIQVWVLPPPTKIFKKYKSNLNVQLLEL